MEFTPEQFSKAFEAAPRPIRSYIVDGKLSAAIVEITKARGLHVDVAGILDNGATQMLLGVTSPAQLLGELVLGGVSAEDGKAILEDLNQKVFTPVRDQVRHFNETGEDLVEEKEPEETEDVTSDTVPPSTAPVPAPVVVSPPPPPPVEKPVSPPQPAPMMPPALPREEEHPAMRTMATDMQAVKEHRAPEPLPYQVPAPASFTPPAPPAAPPVRVAPPPAPPPVAPVRSTPPPPSNLPGAPVVHEYSVDPYREPIE